MGFRVGEKVMYANQWWKVVYKNSGGSYDIENANDRKNYVPAARLTKSVKEKKVKAQTVPALGFVGQKVLGFKLKLPKGAKLNETEANHIIQGWEDEKAAVKTRQTTLTGTSEKIDKHLAQTSQMIPDAIKDLKEARRWYKQSTHPLKKKSWAKKIVVRAAYYEQLRNSHSSLTSTVERIRDAVDDAQYIWMTLESRIAEARIYRELNGGLNLVGKALQDARSRHLLPEVEYSNLEVTMENVEEAITNKSDDEIMREAEAIANDESRWTENGREEKEDKKSA